MINIIVIHDFHPVQVSALSREIELDFGNKLYDSRISDDKERNQCGEIDGTTSLWYGR